MTGVKFLHATIVSVALWAALATPGRSQSFAATKALDVSDSSRNSELANIRHIVVIYQENHSFDNLYGGWEGVNGRVNADSAHTIQVGQIRGLQGNKLLSRNANFSRIATLNHKPVNRIAGDCSADFTSEFLKRCHEILIASNAPGHIVTRPSR